MGRPKGFDRIVVLNKSMQLFWKKGYADTSIQDLETVTAVNKSGLYSEFKNKSDLFVASLQQYLDQRGFAETLKQKPLGWERIKEFLLLGVNCPGRKGCFAANSMREFDILPLPARRLILSNATRVKGLLIENLTAIGVHGSEDTLADIIITFNSGLALELGVDAGHPSQMENRIDLFLSHLKALPKRI